MIGQKTVFRLLSILIICMLTIDGSAQRRSNSGQGQQSWDRLSLELGGYAANINSNFRLGLDNLGIGLDIDFEEALGLETTAFTFNANAKYRFSKNRRHAASFRYFDFNRKATKTLQAEIEINDRVFSAGTELGSSFGLSVINADYSYSFLMDDRMDINASFGFFVMPIKFSVSKNDQAAESTSFTAPLPALGLESGFILSPKFSLHQSVHLFYIQLNNLQGKMTDLSIKLEYRPIINLGLGTGFNTFAVDIQQSKTKRPLFGDLVGNIGYKHTGFLLYAVFYLQ
ncbi:MAG: hypothetical protein KQI35_01280 [Bacteroidetes bacterium]|nr:hypothetical protein [Bacteroidota bacterium]